MKNYFELCLDTTADDVLELVFQVLVDHVFDLFRIC